MVPNIIPNIIIGAATGIVIILLLQREFYGRWERQRLRSNASKKLDELVIASQFLISAHQDYRLHTASVVYRAEKIDKQINETIKNIEGWVAQLEAIIRPTYKTTNWYKRHRARYDVPAATRTWEERTDRWIWLSIVAPIGRLIYKNLYQRINQTTREDVGRLELAYGTMDEVLEDLALALEYIEYATTPTIKAKGGEKITPVEFRDKMVNGQVEARKGERKPMKSWQERERDRLKEEQKQ